MKEKIAAIEQQALADIAQASDPAQLEALRVRYLGRKGAVNDLFRDMASLGPDGKAEAGRLMNALKSSLSAAFDGKSRGFAGAGAGRRDSIDVTLPGIAAGIGNIHPITKTIDEICSIFIGLGFMVVEGPEIETEYYNFETLNIPLEHPSRDAFDTFYLKPQSGKFLLRSHTSPVQTRFMEKNKPPFSIVVPGKVYRPDATDASHSFMFHQVEGLAVGPDIKFSDLKGVLLNFAKQMFGHRTKIRLRPSFFPFTEPSAEVDISCAICSNETLHPKDEKRRCGVCGGKGWLEVLGAGMVNPKVFERVGYDPRKVTGLAFGMGVERIAMLKYGITDIRMFFENDIRFLRQF